MRKTIQIILTVSGGVTIGVMLSSIFYRCFPNNGKLENLGTEQFLLPQRASFGEAILYGKMFDGSVKKEQNEIYFQLVEWVIGSDNQEQSAIEDGDCDIRMIETDSCIPANFYVRNTDKVLSLPLSDEVSVWVMARDGMGGGFLAKEDGSIYQNEVNIGDFAAILEKNDFTYIPFIITTRDGAVVSIREQYVP